MWQISPLLLEVFLMGLYDPFSFNSHGVKMWFKLGVCISVKAAALRGTFHSNATLSSGRANGRGAPGPPL